MRMLLRLHIHRVFECLRSGREIERAVIDGSVYGHHGGEMMFPDSPIAEYGEEGSARLSVWRVV